MFFSSFRFFRRQGKSRFNDWKTRHVCYTFVEHGRSWTRAGEKGKERGFRGQNVGWLADRLARHSYYVRGRFPTDTRCSSAKKGAGETVVGPSRW